MVFPNGEVTYMNGRRELLNSEELEKDKNTWASTIQANKDAFIQAGLVNAKPQEETKSETKSEVKINYNTNNVFIGGEFGTGTINITCRNSIVIYFRSTYSSTLHKFTRLIININCRFCIKCSNTFIIIIDN